MGKRLLLSALRKANRLVDLRVLRAEFFRFNEFGESVLQIPGAAIGQSEVLVQESQSAAVPTNLEALF